VTLGLAILAKAALTIGPLSELPALQPRLATLPLPAHLWPLPVVLLAVGGTLLTAGRAVRLGGVLAAAGGLLTLTADARLYTNHLWLLVMLSLLAAVTLPQARIEEGPTTLCFGHLVLTQLTVVYGFAATSKLNPGFTSGAVLYGDLSAEGALLEVPVPLLLRGPLVWLAILTILIEVVLAIGLWLPGFRGMVAVIGSVFHVMIVVLMPGWADLLVFALLCCGTYPLFLTRDSPAAEAAGPPSAPAIVQQTT
jgi:hypothetical protein